MSVGTTNPRIAPSSPSSTVRAQTTATSATEPFVIHILLPVSTQSVPSRRARVRMPPGFDPKSGSVSPKQPIASPVRHPRQPGRPSARPSRASRSRTSPAIPAPTRPTGDRSRRPRAPGRPGRTPWRWCRRSRTGEVHPEQSELPELEREVADRDVAAFVPSGDLRPEPVVDEGAHGVADGAVLVADQGVGVEQGERSERWHGDIMTGPRRTRAAVPRDRGSRTAPKAALRLRGACVAGADAWASTVQRASMWVRPLSSTTGTQCMTGRSVILWSRMGHLLFILRSPSLAHPHREAASRWNSAFPLHLALAAARSGPSVPPRVGFQHPTATHSDSRSALRSDLNPLLSARNRAGSCQRGG